ncbi:MAG: terpene cyclase/mutase family protein [Kiritimatiellae bacterium]|nr:terpene cyclase/mutase family protein [Kiritimatiellia bacterium]
MNRALSLVLLITAISTAAYGMPAKHAPEPKSSGRSVSIMSATQPSGTLGVSLRNEVNAAIDRGIDWIMAQQKKDGSWSNGNYPALTALPLKALAKASHPGKKPHVDKGIKHILSCVQEDGGIYKKLKGRKGGGLSNYNTAISMSALHATGNKSLVRTILNARKFIAGTQYLGNDVYKGGFGYDAGNKRAYTDILNTSYTIEAMVDTAGLEDLRPKSEKRVDINWDETVKYLGKLQNKPSAGKDQEGGYYYRPGESKAGTTTNKAGMVVFRSYGSITYVGMLAMIHANVSRDDVRVKSAFNWSTKHWSLTENPGMGTQGLFFFYNILTKSMAAYGQDSIPTASGKMINWREEIAKQLVSMQKIDPKTGHGYWKNDTARFWEADPVLSTAYIILALQML